MELDWTGRPPVEGTVIISAIDAHAAGEPLRIVTRGLPPLSGDTMLERRRTMLRRYDHVRRALMWEPRGHADMYGCVLTPPVTPDADFGVLFMHNEGYSTMCGHGVIALVTALIETGAIPAKQPRTPVTLDTPAGLVRATAEIDPALRVTGVSFLNVPSFVFARDLTLEISSFGTVVLDVAFGGAFYAVLAAASLGLAVQPANRATLVQVAKAVQAAVREQLVIRHPTEPELGFLYGTILVGPPEDPAHHSRNICVFANAEVDRSPTGTGVSARIALLHARREVAGGETIVVESILGARSTFAVRVVEQTRVGECDAVIPEVRGRGYLTGRAEFLVDPRDPLNQGFLV